MKRETGLAALPAVPRLLGALAFLAPLPLPLNQVLEWPVLGLYWLLIALFLRRQRRQAPPLPAWAMNVLGLAYLPVLFVDLQLVAFRGQIVQTVIHICLFTVVVKLFALRGLRDVWHTFGAIFFLFLAAMGTSVHPTILLYLLAFTIPAMVLLVRLAMVRVLSRYDRAGEILEKTPVVGFVIGALAAMVVLAIPLFVIFPRISSPFVGIRGTGTGTRIYAAGYTDEVTLDTIGGQRNNPGVAMRLQFVGGRPPGDQLRLKGGSFDVYEKRRWRASAQDQTLTGDGNTFHLSRDPVEGTVDVWLQPLGTKSVILPVQAVTVELEVPVLNRDRGGAVGVWRAPSSVLAYRVGMAAEPVLFGPEPLSVRKPEASDRDPVLDPGDLSPRAIELAADVMGEGTPREKARRLEHYLITEYSFSLDFVGLTGRAPIDDFLFVHRQGHCELFASAMVLMLRSQGIPARLATGFLGAELNPLTDYYVVRQSNAHAWVEAYLADQGWTIFDPTPPAGRPLDRTPEGFGLFRQAWDYLLFRWDRYVLTYGFEDQLSFLWGAREAWFRLRDWLTGDDEPAVAPAAAAAEAAGSAPVPEDQAAPAPSGLGDWWLLGVGFLAAVLGALLWWQRRLERLTATRAFERLRRLVRARGVELPDNTTAAELERSTVEHFPAAAAGTARIVDLYLHESFGGRALDDETRQDLARALEDARRGMNERRKAG
ncbi:MAG: DUF3488 domain-containing protein [Acidobacteria bacterium]|nr:DUF3488 domain-containing protein [Acidobacteriota bacterium]